MNFILNEKEKKMKGNLKKFKHEGWDHMLGKEEEEEALTSLQQA